MSPGRPRPGPARASEAGERICITIRLLIRRSTEREWVRSGNSLARTDLRHSGARTTEPLFFQGVMAANPRFSEHPLREGIVYNSDNLTGQNVTPLVPGDTIPLTSPLALLTSPLTAPLGMPPYRSLPLCFRDVPLPLCVLTDWLSIMASDGWRWRPSAARRSPRRASCRRSRVPSFFQVRKYQYTVPQGGTSCGNALHWQPGRATYSRALTISRRSCLAGRPLDFGAGTNRSTWVHSGLVRSLG
jgi:hypothetical protein